MAQSPHDALFKRVFSNATHAAGEFRSVLPPALVKAMDFKSLSLCPGSFVDQKLRERHTDLLYSVRLREREAFLYLLFEHQSTVDVLMPYRLLGYICRVWERWVRENPKAPRLPAVIPVVLHHSETGWTAATQLREIIDLDGESLEAARAYLPDFQFCLDDLRRQSEAVLYGRAMMTFLSRMGLLTLALRRVRGGRFPVEFSELYIRAMREFGETPNGQEEIQPILCYLMDVDDERGTIIDMLRTEDVGENIREAYVTLTQRFIEEGLTKGRREGLREGAQQEARNILMRQLRLRFGAVDAATESRIAKATVEELHRWAERILIANQLDDLWS